MIDQATEEQCQDCIHWLKRTKGSTACFPRAFSYVLSVKYKGAAEAHAATFKNCRFKVR